MGINSYVDNTFSPPVPANNPPDLYRYDDDPQVSQEVDAYDIAAIAVAGVIAVAIIWKIVKWVKEANAKVADKAEELDEKSGKLDEATDAVRGFIDSARNAAGEAVAKLPNGETIRGHAGKVLADLFQSAKSQIIGSDSKYNRLVELVVKSNKLDESCDFMSSRLNLLLSSSMEILKVLKDAAGDENTDPQTLTKAMNRYDKIIADTSKEFRNSLRQYKLRFIDSGRGEFYDTMASINQYLADLRDDDGVDIDPTAIENANKRGYLRATKSMHNRNVKDLAGIERLLHDLDSMHDVTFNNKDTTRIFKVIGRRVNGDMTAISYIIKINLRLLQAKQVALGIQQHWYQLYVDSIKGNGLMRIDDVKSAAGDKFDQLMQSVLGKNYDAAKSTTSKLKGKY